MIPHRQGLGSRAVLKGAYALRIANPLSVPGCTQLALASTPARARQSPRLLYANIVARANTWCVRLIFFPTPRCDKKSCTLCARSPRVASVFDGSWVPWLLPCHLLLHQVEGENGIFIESKVTGKYSAASGFQTQDSVAECAKHELGCFCERM